MSRTLNRFETSSHGDQSLSSTVKNSTVKNRLVSGHQSKDRSVGSATNKFAKKVTSTFGEASASPDKILQHSQSVGMFKEHIE